MQVGGPSDPFSHLRLVGGINRLQQIQPVAPITRRADGFAPTQTPGSPAAQLPQAPERTAAVEAKLDAIKASLVGGKTDVPIHFQEPVARPTLNPYAHAYLKMTANHAQIHAGATERAVEQGDL